MLTIRATKRGIKARICMPLTTLVKLPATRGYGADLTAALEAAGYPFERVQ
jgi:threonine dehydratase